MMIGIGIENRTAAVIVMTVGALMALLLGALRAKRAGIAPKKIALCAVLLPLMAAFCSHFLYSLVTIGETQSFAALFLFWERGGMVYGGMIGCLIALWLAGGKRFGELAEAFAPSGAWMIAVTRICEGLLGQGYGEYGEENPFFCRFPFMMYDADYEVWAWSLFVLEAVIALALFVYLLCRKPAWPGDGMLLLIGLYACAQALMESLRRDEFLRWGFVRVCEVGSAVVILAVLLCYLKAVGPGHIPQKMLWLLLFVAMVVLCLLLEFALEGRVSFLMFLDVSACYWVMAGACALMGVSIFGMRSLKG